MQPCNKLATYSLTKLQQSLQPRFLHMGIVTFIVESIPTSFLNLLLLANYEFMPFNCPVSCKLPLLHCSCLGLSLKII